MNACTANFSAIGKAFELYSQQLTNLKIVTIRNGDGYAWQRVNYFAAVSMQLCEGDRVTKFPLLEKLFLSSISFQEYDAEMACAFNIISLESLTLHYCEGIIPLFEQVLVQGQEMKLRFTSLEIASRYIDICHCLSKIVARLIGQYQGLKKFCFAWTGPANVLLLLESLGRHKSSLRKLVLHGTDFSGGPNLWQTLMTLERTGGSWNILSRELSFIAWASLRLSPIYYVLFLWPCSLPTRMNSVS